MNKRFLKLEQGVTLTTNSARKSKFNAAFTLAEVLITLGIIGVVAAMTIPTLIANTRSQQYRSQFKKSLSTLNQAARMAQAQYDFDFGGISRGEYNWNSCPSDNPQTDKTMCALLNGTLSGGVYITTGLDYLSNYNNLRKMHDSSNYIVYQLADGAYFIFTDTYNNLPGYPSGCMTKLGQSLVEDVQDPNNSQNMIHSLTLTGCTGYIDVNGITKPNKEVQCASEDTNYDPTNPCTVDNASMGDIFPVVFHDGSVEPATNAAAYVLRTSK